MPLPIHRPKGGDSNATGRNNGLKLQRMEFFVTKHSFLQQVQGQVAKQS
jgi:hypothetical protein